MLAKKRLLAWLARSASSLAARKASRLRLRSTPRANCSATDSRRSASFLPKRPASVKCMGRQKNGKAAEDLVIEVPLGTQLYEVPPETSLYEAPVEPDQEDAPEAALAVPEETEPEKPVLVADLTEPGQTYVACRGGRGGKGNLHFTSSTMLNQDVAKGTVHTSAARAAAVDVVGI